MTRFHNFCANIFLRWECIYLQDLAGSFGDADELAKHAYNLYSEFRPQIAQGQAGWGKPGLLDLQQIKDLHKKGLRPSDVSIAAGL